MNFEIKNNLDKKAKKIKGKSLIINYKHHIFYNT